MLYRSFQRNLLTYLMSNLERFRPIISKMEKLQKPQIEFKFGDKSEKYKNTCPECRITIKNILLLVFHLELTHSHALTINNYEICKDKVILHIEPNNHAPPPDYLVSTPSCEMLLLGGDEDRLNDIMRERVFEKLRRTARKERRRVYYHSTDIFREVGSSSEEVDSEREVNYLEDDLETRRIADFTDVNECDKKLFRLWNRVFQLRHPKRKSLDEFGMGMILQEFAVECKKEAITKKNLFIHCYTLWCNRKVYPKDILAALHLYDQYIPLQ